NVPSRLQPETSMDTGAGTYQLLNVELHAVKKQRLDSSIMKKHLKKASEQVVVENTLQEYRRYWDQFTAFCAQMGFINGAEEFETFNDGIPEDFPTWMAVWIMSKADELDVQTGKPKDPSITRVKYATAQKMRAAISHKFGRDFGLGDQPWTQSPVTGKFTGNPSLSVTVSQYMISLQRRKVRAGEEVTSARAITHDLICQLWTFNRSVARMDRVGTSSRKRKAEHPEDWAGYRVRQMLQLLYTISMLCLLRYDEALRIRWSDIEMLHRNGVPCVKLSLPFRKTAQYGGVSSHKVADVAPTMTQMLTGVVSQ
ncbi:hypothetical protein EVJ58_g10970, partial [Rhodofomes roseus]